jgi:hypothetical protein
MYSKQELFSLLTNVAVLLLILHKIQVTTCFYSDFPLLIDKLKALSCLKCSF